jgi:beta-phosphoglucomutase-like phosphatase (HAD superfamily)
MARIQALLFDVDGTIADTEEGHRTAFNLAFERCRLGWNWSRDEYRGLLRVAGGKERLAYYIDHLQVGANEKKALVARLPDIHREKTKFYSSLAGDGGIPLRPGIARLIGEAADVGLKLGIASTTTRANIDALLSATLGPTGMALFAAVACGDQVPNKKPAPDIYKLALRVLEVPADRSIAFEDSVNGLRAAAGAGLRTVVTPTFWTEGADFASAIAVLPHLGDPWLPLAGEPGRVLRGNAWVSLTELERLAT